MLTLQDLQVLDEMDKTTPVKEISKKLETSPTNIYRKIHRFNKHGLITRVSDHPVKYTTTFKGGVLLIFLRKYEELL